MNPRPVRADGRSGRGPPEPPRERGGSRGRRHVASPSAAASITRTGTPARRAPRSRCGGGRRPDPRRAARADDGAADPTCPRPAAPPGAGPGCARRAADDAGCAGATDVRARQDRGGGVQVGVEDVGRGVLELPDDLAGARRAHPAAVGPGCRRHRLARTWGPYCRPGARAARTARRGAAVPERARARRRRRRLPPRAPTRRPPPRAPPSVRQASLASDGLIPTIRRQAGSLPAARVDEPPALRPAALTCRRAETPPRSRSGRAPRRGTPAASSARPAR